MRELNSTEVQQVNGATISLGLAIIGKVINSWGNAWNNAWGDCTPKPPVCKPEPPVCKPEPPKCD
ncbi:hypothetical protein V1447_000929 [Serratia marcescens]|nr:hypothetical protein [Serratia marcescens]